MKESDIYRTIIKRYEEELEKNSIPHPQVFIEHFDIPNDERDNLIAELMGTYILNLPPASIFEEIEKCISILPHEEVEIINATAIDKWSHYIEEKIRNEGKTHEHPIVPNYDSDSWEVIGKGAMGKVWKAKRKDQEDFDAFKVLVNGSNDIIKNILLREGAIASRIRHPNVCEIYNIQTLYKPYHIHMEYIEGVQLNEWATNKELIRIINVMIDVARAVDAIHQKEVIHQDLKPNNIIVEEKRNRPVVIDFGLAQHLKNESSKEQLAGTYAYMAPEQVPVSIVDGQRGRVSELTDVYGVGATLYWAATSKLPIPLHSEEDSSSYLKRVATEKRIVTDLPRDLQAVCEKAMALNQNDRYTTAEMLAQDLERYLRKERVRSLPCPRSGGVC